jgi:glycosyltransferase involved in cell wall biosynthesis
MKISVILPCLNAAGTIELQLEALAKQKTTAPYEIIISDNGSTDATLNLVQKFKSRFKELTIVDSSDKKGPACARNKGIKAARGNILLFCDADDKVGDGWIEAMHQALMNHRFVAGRLKWLKTAKENHSLGRGVPQGNGLQSYDYPKFMPHAGGGNLGVRRSIHELVGGFDESWPRLSDTDYCWRIQLNGVKLHYEPKAVIYMRTRDNMSSMVKQSYIWGRYNVLLYKRYLPYGMPMLSWKSGVRNWILLIRKIPRLRKKRQVESWLWWLSWRLGRLDGCLKYRILAI